LADSFLERKKKTRGGVSRTKKIYLGRDKRSRTELDTGTSKIKNGLENKLGGSDRTVLEEKEKKKTTAPTIHSWRVFWIMHFPIRKFRSIHKSSYARKMESPKEGEGRCQWTYFEILQSGTTVFMFSYFHIFIFFSSLLFIRLSVVASSLYLSLVLTSRHRARRLISFPSLSLLCLAKQRLDKTSNGAAESALPLGF
jgi:hypothetical protein